MSVQTLDMVFEEVDGVWIVDAPWLEEPVTAPTYYEAWEKAVKARFRLLYASLRGF